MYTLGYLWSNQNIVIWFARASHWPVVDEQCLFVQNITFHARGECSVLIRSTDFVVFFFSFLRVQTDFSPPSRVADETNHFAARAWYCWTSVFRNVARLPVPTPHVSTTDTSERVTLAEDNDDRDEHLFSFSVRLSKWVPNGLCVYVFVANRFAPRDKPSKPSRQRFEVQGEPLAPRGWVFVVVIFFSVHPVWHIFSCPSGVSTHPRSMSGRVSSGNTLIFNRFFIIIICNNF